MTYQFEGKVTIKKINDMWHANLIPKGKLYMNSTCAISAEKAIENLQKCIEEFEKVKPKYL